MSKRVYRSLHALLFLITTLVLFASLYLQYVTGLEPCPLCIMQRISVFFLFLFCLMALCLSTLKRARLVAALQIFFASAGLYFAGRQLWLQSLPPEKTPACMPGLDVLIQYFPWQEVMRALFLGAGDCAETAWLWLGLSMPAWASLYFVGILTVNVILYCLLGKRLEKITG